MPETTPAHDPTLVGQAFMRQYYQFLAKEPQSLHRFYKDESRWCHGRGSRMEEPIAGQRAINEQILKRGYAGARVDLETGSIDCQASLDGGVVVLVTGAMTLPGAQPQPFVQSFFLAVQPKGYFVLNDCLRFLELPAKADKAPTKADKVPAKADKADKAPKKDKEPAAASPVKKAPASPKKPATPAKLADKPQKLPETKAAEPAAAPAAASPKKQAKPASPTKEKPAAPASPAPKPATPAASPAQAAKPVASPAPAEPAQPKTWAALFSGRAATPAAPAPPAPTPVAAAPASAPAAAPATEAKTPSPTKTAEASKEGGRPRYFSLFIRNVPETAKDTELRELFKSYGAVAGVNIVSARGYAFVDFIEEESMRAVLADSREFTLLDKTLQVEERTERKGESTGWTFC